MGLFNLFKKKGEDKNEPKPEEQMLTLNERQKPALKSDTKPPTAPPAVQVPNTMLTPDPEINNSHKSSYDFSERPAPEPVQQEYLRENLSTKSLEKSIQTMPSVKKLIIPSNNDSMAQKVEATDTAIVERVPMKQVDLQQGSKSDSISPNSINYIPGEFIDIPISFFTESIGEQYLSKNAKTLFDNSTKIRFTKDEILSIMAQGSFSVVGSALLARFPGDMVSQQGKTTSEVFVFPLDQVMALIPPDWFTLQGQDNSLSNSLNNMANPFQDLEEPDETTTEDEKPEATPTETANSSLFSDDEEEEIEITTEIEDVDALETIVQIAPPLNVPEKIDPLATLEQRTPPPAVVIDDAKTDDNTLVIDAAIISGSLNPEVFSDYPGNTNLKIPRDRVLKSLAEGVFNFTAQEIDSFGGTSTARNGKENEIVSLDLGLIMGLIPPEWFTLQEQDNSQNEILTNMRDVFDDSTFEEAAREAEAENQEEGLGETVTDANNLQAPQEDEDELEVSVESEDEEDGEESLITGGIFSKMNNLFEDEDEEDEEELEVSIESEEPPALETESQESLSTPAAASPLLAEEDEDEEIALSIEEDATVTTVEEESIKTPIIEEEHPDTLQTVTISRDDNKIFDDQRVLEEQKKELEAQQETEKEAPAIDSMPTLIQLTPPPAVKKPLEEKVQIPPAAFKPEAKVQERPPEEDKVVPDAGKITYRAVNENVPDITDKTILRPSTAPNGIDINRSNLADLCRLHSAGEKLAQTLIEYREKNGDFKSINELINVPGIGSSVYKSLTGLRPSADLVAAERRINNAVGLDTDKDYPLGKIISEAQNKFKFKSIILSDKDGFEICFSGDKSLLDSNSELLAATTPQLFKRTKHFLKQSLLPHPEVFTFYLEDTPVTFGIADEVYMVMVHSSNWPESKHMKQCRTLINELAWFCSYRAIV